MPRLMVWFVWHRVTPSINQLDDLPMPAAARYCARGQPSPPQPTTSTEVLDKLSWPVDNKKCFTLLCSAMPLTSLDRMLTALCIYEHHSVCSHSYLEHRAQAEGAVCCTAWCLRCSGLAWPSGAWGVSLPHTALVLKHGPYITRGGIRTRDMRKHVWTDTLSHQQPAPGISWATSTSLFYLGMQPICMT